MEGPTLESVAVLCCVVLGVLGSGSGRFLTSTPFGLTSQLQVDRQPHSHINVPAAEG